MATIKLEKQIPPFDVAALAARYVELYGKKDALSLAQHYASYHRPGDPGYAKWQEMVNTLGGKA